jgi:uncharacterized protein
MFIGTIELEIFIPWSSNLKEKRKVIRSLQDKLKHKYNVSVAEVDYHEKWQRALIGLCFVNGKRKEVEIKGEKIKHFVSENYDFMVIDARMEIIGPEEE